MIALVTGGAASGKSAFAERLAATLAAAGEGAPLPLTYVATMRVYDADAAKRVERHRAQRADKGFATYECPSDLSAVPTTEGVVLLEDLGNFAANLLWPVGSDGLSAVGPVDACAASGGTLGPCAPWPSPKAGHGVAAGLSHAPAAPPLTSLGGAQLLRLSERAASPGDSLLAETGLSHLFASNVHAIVVGNEVGAEGAPRTPEMRAYVRALGTLSCAVAAQADLVVEVVAGMPCVVKGEVPWMC